MKGDDQVIIHFNNLLENELIAANQYFLHCKLLKSWGFTRLYNIEKQEYIDERNHASICIDRILFLEGIPNIRNLEQLKIGKDTEEILRFDLDLEICNTRYLKECIAYTDLIRDFVSENIMMQILIEEEKHINFLETELSLINKIGINNYLQSQLK